MLNVYTAEYDYKGEDRLDITAKTSDGLFAPAWDMIWNYKRGIISKQEFTELYTQKMRESYIENKERWLDVLQRDKVTLVCFCNNGNFCHRLILADIFTRFGATYMGER